MRPERTRPTCSPTRTCSITRCFPDTTDGRPSCGPCDSWWSTNAMATGGVRLPCRPGPPPASSVGRRLRREPGLRAGVGHDGRAGGKRQPVGRAAGGPSGRRRLASGSGRLRAVGTPTSSGTCPMVPGRTGRRCGAALLVETADLLADLGGAGARTVAFVRSRRSAETVATLTRNALKPVAADLAEQVAAYRAGYLPHERRALEKLKVGALRGGRGHQRARTRCGHRRTGRRAHGRLARYPCITVAAGRAGRPCRSGGAGRVGRTGRPAGHLRGHTSGGGVRSVRRSDGARPGQPICPRPSPVCGGRRVAAVRRRCRTVRPVGAAGAGLAGAPPSAPPTGVGLVLDPPRLGYRPGRPPWHRWPAGPAARGRTGRLLGTVDPGRAHATVHEGAVYVHQGRDLRGRGTRPGRRSRGCPAR